MKVDAIRYNDRGRPGLAQKCTEQQFHAFLDRLSADRDEAGVIYNRLREKLIVLFERELVSAPQAAELSDETMDRVVRVASTEGQIESLTAYACTVGRFVRQEFLRTRGRETPFSEVPEPQVVIETPDSRLRFLEECLEKLPAEQREFILIYHRNQKSEKFADHAQLAEKFKLSSGALRIRALRIREKLERCIELAIKKDSARNVLRNDATH
jgi:DNA-directed RNA polymerase specialized sigma24 family protein